MITSLQCIYDTRQSFYDKAQVEVQHGLSDAEIKDLFKKGQLQK